MSLQEIGDCGSLHFFLINICELCITFFTALNSESLSPRLVATEDKRELSTLPFNPELGVFIKLNVTDLTRI